jgi:iron complex transport system substrate-binding protein
MNRNLPDISSHRFASASIGLVAISLLTVVLLTTSPARAVCIADDSGIDVCLDASPSRVVSLYGAFTEILWEIGAGETLVARTKSDTTIPAVAELPSVGTGLRPNVEYLLALRPDLVVSRASRAASAALTALRARGLRVAAFDPRSLDDVYATIRRLGTLLEHDTRAQRLVDKIRVEVTRIQQKTVAVSRRLRVVYEVRADPLTVTGSRSLVDELIRAAGGVNAVVKPKKLLMLDVEALLRLDPDVYVVQQGPMNRNPSPPSKRPHLASLRAVRAGRVLFVDERLFSRPGPRAAEAVQLLSRFLYPALWPPADNSR